MSIRKRTVQDREDAIQSVLEGIGRIYHGQDLGIKLATFLIDLDNNYGVMREDENVTLWAVRVARSFEAMHAAKRNAENI